MSQRTSRKFLPTNENILYELNDYDRQRTPQILIDDDDHIQCVPVDPIVKSLSCPICLDLFNRTMVTTICLHRFCADCIHRWLKSDNKVCPTCRKTLKSKRYLRSDSRTDLLVDFVKKQQAKTSELAEMYREQQQHD
ncbi:unnamed protein product [Rotaria magnacalcarata]|uniref:RING-type E3 ubiquitin transferase n=2 Tax=Rotaria magnacalcarata TaxID=392030 RepID=A0A815EP16_9BILA|nr:unnamed protein product [Rotaria magnacalcarata]CAF1673689.1 unnamed protein product [Rotaria magnacalcarata]CAF2004303.1 unnamed protein product [Rotaria magnacalcarata]CAF2035519.1 unnamed protein product [Rotaria magnacalcarata]CAF2157374.1 unnamed protein product [Rotaria magnacalcarata]